MAASGHSSTAGHQHYDVVSEAFKFTVDLAVMAGLQQSENP
jgi:hypothetical protein